MATFVASIIATIIMKKPLFLLAVCLLTLPALSQDFSFPGRSKADVTRLLSVHPWGHARVAYFGDSLTDPAVGGSDNKYWSFLEHWLDIQSFVYAVNGRQWDDVPRQARLLKEQHGNDFDAIVILMGTNDYNAGIPIGEWFDETTLQVEAATGEPKQNYLRRHREPSMNPDTYRGRINRALSLIKKLFPTKQVVLLTTPHRGSANFGNTNVQPDDNYQNKSGLYLDPYVESVREAGQIWSMPVVDLYSLCGILPTCTEQQPYMNGGHDLLHPNRSGNRRIALALYWQFLSLPCKME